MIRNLSTPHFVFGVFVWLALADSAMAFYLSLAPQAQQRVEGRASR